MSTAMEQGPSFLASMQEATRAHYGLDPNRKPWGRAEFDALLGDCDVILDVPLCCFVDELVAAYPEAKVLLTERDADAWIRSMDKTVWVVHGWGKSWDVVAGWHPVSYIPLFSMFRYFVMCPLPLLFPPPRERVLSSTLQTHTHATLPHRSAPASGAS